MSISFLVERFLQDTNHLRFNIRVDPVSFFRTIVFSRKRFILTKAFSKTLLKKRNWKLSKAFLSQRKRNWHFTNAFLTELKRFRNLSKASQTKLKIVDCVFSDSYYNVAFKLSEAFLSRKRFRFKCVFFFNYVRKEQSWRTEVPKILKFSVK